MADALPALEAARLALDDLDRNDVTETRYRYNCYIFIPLDTFHTYIAQYKSHMWPILSCVVQNNVVQLGS